VFALSYLLSFAAAMTRATRVVAVSQYTADEIRKRSFRKAVVAFTPLNLIGGIRHVRPREERDALFVYNGGLDGRKGVAELLLGFAEFIRERPDFKLVMMGRGYDGIADQTAALRKSGNLDLPGYLSEDEKFELIGRAEAVIYPSRLEGYGLPIAEAIASQTPVICGLGGAQREVGGDAAIYLKAVTAGEILDALRRVANHALPANYRERQASQLAWLTDDRHQTQLLSALGAPD
jgi:glycosyltransferase involved in cell wall biosynthesis